MDDKLQNIDHYYKEKLDGYSARQNTHVWNRLRWVLLWDRYKYWLLSALFVLVLGTGYCFYHGLSNSSPPLMSHQNEITSINQFSVSELTKSIEKDVSPEENIVIPSSAENDSPEGTSNNSNAIPNETNLTHSKKTEDLFPEREMTEPDAETRTLYYQNIVIGRFKAHNIANRESGTLIEFPNAETSKPKGKGMFSVSIFAGPSLSDFNLSGANEEYMNYRNDNESSHLSWTAGTRLSYQVRNFIITTGIDYSVYNQKRSYSRTSKVYSPDDSYYDYDTTWTWIFDPPDIGIPVISDIDSTWISVYNDHTIENNGINRMNYLEIPLLVGYQTNQKRFTFEISGGLGFGFLIDQDITVPSTSNDSTFIVVKNLRKNNVNLMINGSIYYHLSRTSSLFITPYYKKGLGSIYYSDYPVYQKLNSFGINFGINFRF